MMIDVPSLIIERAVRKEPLKVPATNAAPHHSPASICRVLLKRRCNTHYVPCHRNRSASLPVLFLVVMFTLLPVIAGNTLPRPELQVRRQTARLYDSMISYFSHLNLIPIPLPSGQMPGDVLNWKNLVLEDRARSCFPDLSLERNKTILPHIASAGLVRGTIGQNLAKVVRAALGNSTHYRVDIAYADAYMLEATRNDLVRTLDQDKCPYLVTVLNEEYSGEEPPLVIGRVLYAKVKITIEGDARSISKLAADLNKLLMASDQSITGLPLPPTTNTKASIEAMLASRRSLIVSSVDPLPVALGPAFLIDHFLISKGSATSEYLEPRPVEFDHTVHHRQFVESVKSLVDSTDVVASLWLSEPTMSGDE